MPYINISAPHPPLLNTIRFISIIADTDNFWALVTKEASYYSPPRNIPALAYHCLLLCKRAVWIDRHDLNKPKD